MIALGLVVVNVGTLYRLRYVFLLLLIVLAAEGLRPIEDQEHEVGDFLLAPRPDNPQAFDCVVGPPEARRVGELHGPAAQGCPEDYHSARS